VMAIVGIRVWQGWKTNESNEWDEILDNAFRVNNDEVVDLDKTVRSIYQLERALEESEDLRGWLLETAQMDLEGVPQEVLDARREMIKTIIPLYTNKRGIEETEELWQLNKEQLLVSGIGVAGSIGVAAATGGVSEILVKGNRAAISARFKDIHERKKATSEMLQEVRELESTLIAQSIRYAETFQPFVQEWQLLCDKREEGWLAALNGDWEKAQELANEAMTMSAGEAEAHILYLWSWVEGANPSSPHEDAILPEDLGAVIIARAPQMAAPVRLLLARYLADTGERDAALEMLALAAKDYPAIAATTADRLDSVNFRPHLRDTAEGRSIIRVWNSVRIGAGSFSANLQKAKLHFDAGEISLGQEQVRAHFQRRRRQGQWDDIVTDLTFCNEVLADSYVAMFPEHLLVTLRPKEQLIGRQLSIAVFNDSGESLTDAKLLLLFRFTDMSPDQIAIYADLEPVAEIGPHQIADFGGIVLSDLVGRSDLRPDDIVDLHAVLLTDQSVTYVRPSSTPTSSVEEAIDSISNTAKAAFHSLTE